MICGVVVAVVTWLHSFYPTPLFSLFLSDGAPPPTLFLPPAWTRASHPQIVGYLKLAHLVPFSVLLDVTKMSPDAVMQTLSAEGRQRGLLLRGNWAARAADVWARGPPHAANCLSVAQCLLHKWVPLGPVGVWAWCVEGHKLCAPEYAAGEHIGEGGSCLAACSSLNASHEWQLRQI